MSFLQPWLLLGLPLIALPIIIHLINQWRFQTIRWAAMMFLLSAQRMARGYSRLRQWLILLFRTVVVATLVFAVSRPLASGWLGLTVGTQADTTIILLDRSPSMQQHAPGTDESKLDTGRNQLVRTLETLGSGRWVLIESVRHEPMELESPAALLNVASAGPASAPADLPRLLQAAYDYIRDNRTGRTEIWICSDLRENDWNARSGRWATLRDAFLELPQGVRFHLLAYPRTPVANQAVRVTEVRRQETGDGAELLVSLRVTRQGDTTDKVSVPVQFEIEGARSVATVELSGAYSDLKNHRIPIARDRQQGWGRVAIPTDANPTDDEFYFVFANPTPRRTIVVAENQQAEVPLRLAAGISPEPTLLATAESISRDQLAAVAWDQIGLVLWQAPLPTGANAELLDNFVRRGGEVMLFPPDNPGSEKLWGLSWDAWQSQNDRFVVGSWRGDDDLVSRTLSGAALPVGQLNVLRYCTLAGELTSLITLEGGAPLLARLPTDRGGIYLWTTTPAPRDSSLAREGIVLYAAVQRALAAGAAVLGKARQLDAGQETDESPGNWQRVSGEDDRLSTEAAYQRGVYQADDRLLAVNRPAAEDEGAVLADARVDELFRDLNYLRVEDQAGNLGSLVQEIWRAFLLAMLIALILEAVLCLPRVARRGSKRMTINHSLTFLWAPWSIAVSLAVIGGTAALCFLAWRRSGYRRDYGVLELLRLATVCVIAVAFNQPEWIEEYRPEEKPSIAVLWDDSASMETRDVPMGESTSAAVATRREAIAPLIESTFWHALEERMNVVVQSFSGGEDKKETNLYEPLVQAPRRLKNLRGIVLATDGDWNTGQPPVQAATALRLKDIPLFVVPVGSPSRLPDVELLSLDSPTFGIVGKAVRVPFTIDSTLPREYLANVTLTASDGQQLTKEVRVAAMGRTNDWILWKPSEVGDYTLTLDVPKQSDELLADNNRLSAPIAIREEKLRVLLVESVPRWEYRYLRNALSRDPGVDLSCLLFHPGLGKVGGGNKDYIKAFPSGLDELAKFDVVFLGDVGLEDGQLTSEDCRLLRGLVEHQASGLVFMPGWQGRQLSLLDSELADLLPVVLDASQPGGWGSRMPSHFELTELGRRSLLTKLADTQGENIEVWGGLPGFQWYAPVVRAKPGSEVLCVHQDITNEFGRLPLLVTRTFGAGKVLFMGTDGAWRWRKGVEDKYHYRFWGQVVRWMAYQRNMAKGETMRMYYSPEQPQVRQTVALNANVMERSGEPLPQGDVTARVVAPSGKAQTVRLSSFGDEWGAFSGRYTTQESGRHEVTLACKQTGATLEASFFVQGAPIERIGQAARPDVLDELARVTRGKVIAVNRLDQVLESLAAMPDPPASVRRVQLWCHPAVMAVLVVMLGAFWVGRKTIGLI